MADNDLSTDFTFCQVSSSSDDNLLESPKAIPTLQNNASKCDVPSSRSDGQVSKELEELSLKGETKSSVDEPSQASLSAQKPKARAKVPFEKGYSQMDWLKLTRTHPDLAGLKGHTNRRLISMDEVKEHKVGASIWTVLKGRVYNIAPYMKFHPGGEDMLMKAAGKDCTSLFNKYHAWVNAEFLLEKCLVGYLDVAHEPSSI